MRLQSMPAPILDRARRRLLGLGGSVLLVTGWAASAQASDPNPDPDLDAWGAAGPLYHSFPLTLEAGIGKEAVGPLYYERASEEAHLWAVPPLISYSRDRDGEQAQVFVLPPLFSWRRYGDDVRWQLGQWINHSRQTRIEDGEVRRVNLFPLFFRQDSPDPARDYWALFPLYGTLQGRLFRDEAEFVAFPLWLKTRKGTMITRNVLFPFVHFREGPGLRGWQFWPLGGHEHLESTTRTNVADEVEIVPGHDKTFALWPIYFRNRMGLGTDNPARIDSVLPLFYVERSPNRDYTSVAWPFVSWTDDRAQKFHQWNAPWPLVGFARGEGKTLSRVLPLFSVGHNRELAAETYLWPLYRRRHLKTDSLDRERQQFGVFLYVDLREKNPETGKSARRIDSWPLFSWSRDPDGNEKLQALSILEPLRRGTGLERNWSPLWAVWRQERNGRTGARSESLLWNLYRREVRPESTKGSLLFGLIQYQKTPAGRRWRVFHLGPRLAPSAETVAPASHVPERR